MNRVWRSSAQVLIPTGTFCSGSFGDVLFWFLRGHSDNGMGRTSDVHRGDFLGGSRPPYDGLCSVLFWVAQYAIHQSFQAIQYTRGSRSYDCQFSVMCTLHLHTLLTEYCTHVYSYIADDIVDIWVGGGVLTFGSRRVYMSILTLCFSNLDFCTYFDYIFLGVYAWEAHWV